MVNNPICQTIGLSLNPFNDKLITFLVGSGHRPGLPLPLPRASPIRPQPST